MTTEENELTFVRCPSCRSLVPAVATRCRMCGYSFEGGAEAESEDSGSSQSRSRVRQRTISATREQLDELSAAGDAAAEEFSAPQESAESRTEKPSLFPPSEEDTSEPLFSGDPFAGDAESNSGSKDEPSVMESFSAAILSNEDSDTNTQHREPEGGQFQSPDPFASEKMEAAQEVKELQSETQSEPQSEPQATPEVQESQDDDEGADTTIETVESNQEQPEKRKRRRRRRKKKSSSQTVEATEVSEKGEKEAMSEATDSKESKSSSSGEDGVLVGWMVSFADDAKGEADELRAGRFFIGRTQLRDDDMVLDQKGVSTPHCLVIVEPEGVVRVQDLMSEQGTFLKKASSKKFEAIGDVAEIEHGDKLKLGSVEFTICLLPSES